MHDGWGVAVIEQAPVSNDRLIAQATLGDRDAFAQLYRRHVGPVYTYLMYNVPTREDAEELTQEVFLRAWRKLEQFRREASLATWLMAIAVTTCRMWHRSRRGRVQEIAVAEFGPAEVDLPGADCAGMPSHDTEDVMDLHRAIGSLPRRARSVLILHELSGYRHREIAKLMGISIGASKAQLSRARRLLAEAMRDG